jgi:hypothetical protein
MKTKILIFSIAILLSSLVSYSQTYDVMWERVSNPDPSGTYYFLSLNKDTMLFRTYDNNIYLTIDGANTFIKQNHFFQLTTGVMKWFKYDSLVQFDYNKLNSTDGKMYLRYSKDLGKTWNLHSEVLDTSDFKGWILLDETFNFFDNRFIPNSDYSNKSFIQEKDRIWKEISKPGEPKLGDSYGLIDGETIILRTLTIKNNSIDKGYLQISRDKGKSWITKDFSKSYYGSKFHFVSKDVIYYIKDENPTNQTILQTILKSTDGGETFTALPIRKEPEETDNSFRWIRFIDENKGYLATTKGLQYTEDGGQTWTLYTNQTFGGTIPGNVGIAEVIHFFDENSGYAYNPSNGTVGLWLYKGRKLSSIKEETSNKTQETFSLKVYPNPNEGSFTVELPEVACQGCMLRMYDLQGKEVLQRSYRQGEKQMVISQSGLAKGTYLVKLTDTVNRREYTNKVVVK